MSLANVGSDATTWSWHPHQDASLTKQPRLSRSTFYYTRSGRSAEYNSETVKADATYRSYADSRKEFTLSWLDNCPCAFTMYILKHSNSSNYCIYIRKCKYTIDTIYFQDFCCKIFSLCSLQLVFAISNLWYLENKLSCFGSNLLIFFVLSAHFNG